MMKFFKKIRQNLLSEGKTGKPAFAAGRYFKYAIGEITLVVIGILIALQINIWNENRKSNEIKQYYLESLKNNIIQDTAHINSRLTDLSHTIYLIDSLSNLSPELSSNESLSAILPNILMNTFNMNIETSTIEDLKSTGNLKLIEDKSLRNLILFYYKDVGSQEKGLNSAVSAYARETIGPYLMKNYGLAFIEGNLSKDIKDRFPLTITQLKRDVFLVNILGFRKMLLLSLKQTYLDALLNANQLLEMIELSKK